MSNLSILEGEIDFLIQDILVIHKRKSIISLKDYDENSFHSVVEVLLSRSSFVSEVRLISEYKKNNHFNYGFSDIFVCDYTSGDSAIIELKLLNLGGLYSGEMNRWVSNPSYEELRKLDNKLKVETDDTLFARNYIYWDKEKNRSTRINVGTYIKNGENQLIKYFDVIKNGFANPSNKKIGIFDTRINVEEGLSFLNRYFIASFGSRRIYTTSKRIKINYKYYINKDS